MNYDSNSNMYSSVLTCERCPQGYYATTAGSKTCTKCPKGYYCSDPTVYLLLFLYPFYFVKGFIYFYYYLKCKDHQSLVQLAHSQIWNTVSNHASDARLVHMRPQQLANNALSARRDLTALTRLSSQSSVLSAPTLTRPSVKHFAHRAQLAHMHRQQAQSNALFVQLTNAAMTRLLTRNHAISRRHQLHRTHTRHKLTD